MYSQIKVIANPLLGSKQQVQSYKILPPVIGNLMLGSNSLKKKNAKLPVDLQQVNVISAKALEAFLHALFNISSINPQNLGIVTNIT